MAGVLLKEVSKRYGGTGAIDRVTLEIPDRQLTVLVGPSGCGKTTVLRLIAGLEEATSGQIYIGDRLVNGVAPRDRNIAMVFQSYALYPHMTVYENLAFGLKLRALDRREIDRRVRETAELLGLAALLDRKPAALSGGERQRVAMGRAMVRKPDLFLFDEPLSNLDAQLRLRMRSEIKQIHARLSTTMIYVTHDQTEAMTLGDRIVVMNRGAVVQEGRPMELYRSPRSLFVAGFIGSPAMNFLEVRVIEAAGEYRLEAKGLDLRLPRAKFSFLSAWQGRMLKLGVRPEHLRPVPEGNRAPITGEVRLLEPLGAETLVHADVGGQWITAACAPRSAPPSGGCAGFAVDPDELHLFDPESETAVRGSARLSPEE
ncbi:MAG TPA: sn-glycerol-3-phosphate ABC transporter ATP-binding protein UgpC [candidate division Zixibacteria bacterium]|nr:sn-glycerol-3-phosphate ABC transporter ATP-binding protein UgpC [candidate division Zixibacteria bacterium]